MCRLCVDFNDGTLQAHEQMYGREEREMAEKREEEYELSSTQGFWDGDGWHWYDDEAWR